MLDNDVFIFDNAVHMYDLLDGNVARHDGGLDREWHMRISAPPRPEGQERLFGRASLLGKPALPVQGSLPIRVEGNTVSGVGVSGVRPDQDEQIAGAGIAAFNDVN